MQFAIVPMVAAPVTGKRRKHQRDAIEF